MSSVDHSRADAHEKHPILGILGMELRHDDIRGGLSKGVRSAYFDLVFGYKIKVGMSRRDESNLLLLAFQE